MHACMMYVCMYTYIPPASLKSGEMMIWARWAKDKEVCPPDVPTVQDLVIQVAQTMTVSVQRRRWGGGMGAGRVYSHEPSS